MVVLEKTIGQLFTFNDRLLIGVKKSVGWLKDVNFAFCEPGYGILVNDTHLPITGNRTYQHKGKLVAKHRNEKLTRMEEQEMKIKTLLSIVLISSLFSMSASLSFAQSNPRYVPLGSATGVLFTPDSGVYSRVGIIQSHPTSNNFGCGTAWASRGFIALCLSARTFTSENAIRGAPIILE